MERKKSPTEILQSVGCLDKVKYSKLKRVKIRPKIVDCVFVKDITNSKEYWLLIKSQNLDWLTSLYYVNPTIYVFDGYSYSNFLNLSHY